MRTKQMQSYVTKNVLGDGIGEVALCDSMGSDLTVVNSARISFQNESDEITTKDEKLISYLAKHNHSSPFRHCFVSLRIKAPEVVMRQWYKHVIGCSWTDPEFHNHGWNEISGRYVEMKPEFYKPESWRKQSKDNKQASEGVHTSDIADECDFLYEKSLSTAYKAYKRMVAVGTSKEEARLVLPLSLYTEVIWTASLQALHNFVTLRDHEHAQYEIRAYAKAIDGICSGLFPLAWQALSNHR